MNAKKPRQPPSADDEVVENGADVDESVEMDLEDGLEEGEVS